MQVRSCVTGAKESDRGTRREARAPPRPARRLPLQGRQGAGGLRGEGGVRPQPRPLLLPGLAHPGREDGRAGRPHRRRRLHRHRQRARGPDPRVEPGQAPPSPLQHHPPGRQALPVPQADDERGVPAPPRGPPRPEGRRDLLRPVLSGDGAPRDAPPRARPVPAPDLQHQDRRHGGAALPPVLHPPVQRALHRMGDARGLRADGSGRRGVPGGPGRGPGPPADRGDGGGRRAGEVRAGRHPARPGPGAEHGPRAPEDHLGRAGGPGHPRPGPAGLGGVRPGLLRASGPPARPRGVLPRQAGHARRTGSSSRRCSASSTRRASSRPARSSCRPRSPRRRCSASGSRQLRDGRVELAVPQRGRKRELVAMAEENAALALQTHLLSRSSRRQVVAEELRRSSASRRRPNRIEGFDISNIQGQEAVGLDGRLGSRRHEEGRLQALQDPHRPGRGRLRDDGRGPPPALRQGPRGRRRRCRTSSCSTAGAAS